METGEGGEAELDDGEFRGELAFESVDAAVEQGEGHGSTSAGGLFSWMDSNCLEGQGLRGDPVSGTGQDVIFWKILSFPLISFHLSREVGWLVGRNGGVWQGFGGY